jgi:pilus assembly protein CpaB
MDRRFLTVLGASLVFALLVSAVFYQLVAGARGRGRPAKVETRDLVIAARSLSPGIVLKPEDLKLDRVPVDQFPRGGFSKLAEAVGRPVISNILAEEPIREGRLAARGSGVGLGAIIPPGMRAVSVRVNDVVGVAGFVLPGMHVDVLVTGRQPGGESNITKTVLQDILVLSAGHNIEPDARGAAVNVPVVTLQVTPSQAETLALASEWRIQLVLRNGADRNIAPTSGQSLDGIFGGAARQQPAQSPRQPVARAAPVAPPPPPKLTEDIVVIRGTQRTVEQVGVRTP